MMNSTELDPPGPRTIRREGRRGLTVLDLTILVAGLALGCLWYRIVEEQLLRARASVARVTSSPAYGGGRAVVEGSFPFLAGVIMSVPALRLLPRRPPWRVLRRQRGWVACLAATAFFGASWAFCGLQWLFFRAFIANHAPADLTVHKFLTNQYDLTILNFNPGWVVGAAWLTQRVLTRPPTATDWVDRLGCILGWYCLAIVAIQWASFAFLNLKSFGVI